MLNALRHQRKNHIVPVSVRPASSGCSTPCGINGKTTNPKRKKCIFGFLCSTPCGINGKTTRSRSELACKESRAQRLAASTEKPLVAGPCGRCLASCAQRLAASTEKPQCDGINDHVVLKCSTPCGINGKTTHMVTRLGSSCFQCSTPCGINGKTTALASNNFLGFTRVLNALRHQRKNHKPKRYAVRDQY